MTSCPTRDGPCPTTDQCTSARSCLAEPGDRDRVRAVLRSLQRMRENPAARHTLADLAQAALLSPFYFHRVFRRVTATTPSRFLTALRMAEAKRLLTETTLNVTEICAEVGYSSLGTFTSQFTRHVGLSPSRYRNAVAAIGHLTLRTVLDHYRRPAGPVVASGLVTGGPQRGASAAVALFRSAIPQGRPVTATVVRVPGMVELTAVPDGDWYAFAMWLDERASISRALREASGPFGFVGPGGAVVSVRQGRCAAPFRIGLRPFQSVDPPIVYAAPLLIAVLVMSEDLQVASGPDAS